jgi:transcriptional regulator with XRE-family HTH domain
MRSRLSDKTGAAIRRLRLARGWSLAQLSETSGVPVSTLSRVELGQNALNYDKLIRLCRALDVDLENLVARQAEQTPPPASGRRSVDRSGAGAPARLGPHAARRMAADLIGRGLSPMVVDVEPSADTELTTLPSEAWLTVLSGAVTLRSTLYAPLDLAQGDSLYLDAQAGFALAATASAKVLLVLAGDIELAS